MIKPVSDSTHAVTSNLSSRTRVPNRASAQLLGEVLDALPEPIYVKDRGHRWIAVNRAFCEFMGRDRRELLGKTESDLLPESVAALAWESDEAVFLTGQGAIDEAITDDDQEISRLLRTEKSLITDAGNKERLLCVIRDLTDSETARVLLRGSHDRQTQKLGTRQPTIKRLGMQTVRFAFSDPLTQLPNRRAFINLLDAAIARVSQSAAVFVINIDHFKLVNDRFGHSAGDSVILEVANRLRRSIRSDDLLGRLDSDEFIVLADGVDAMEADRVIDEIRANMNRALQIGEHEYRISLTIGVAMWSEHGRSAEELVRNAGMAMLWCKRRSRGSSEYYSDGANAAAARTASIELKLPLALEEDSLRVHYQPIVRGVDRVVSAFEALVRWQDPELGEVTPVEFIPIAEEMGLIRRLGREVLDQACEFAATLKAPISVSVNVSGSQLHDETFPIFVAETLQKHDISGERIFFEITESVAMKAEACVWQVFDQLSSIGVRLIIDDFGTGFSNLARLKELPFFGIKVDREFIRDLPNSPQDYAIFRATHAIAKELNLTIVAEGVDNHEQERLLLEFGIDFLQGYRFGQALPAEKLLRYTKQ